MFEKITSEQIKEEIESFSPHSSILSYSTLLAVNQGISVINFSEEGGQGKSRCTGDLLKILGIKHNVVSGHITPFGFYELLEEDGITVLDESALILKDKKIVDMLLSALWAGKIYWKTKWDDEVHEYTGTILFNLNEIPKHSMFKPLKDRVIFNKIKLSSSDIIDKGISTRTYEPNMKIWREIGKRIEREENLTNEEYFEVERRFRNSSPKSVRVLDRIEKIAKFSKALVGDLSLLEVFDYK